MSVNSFADAFQAILDGDLERVTRLLDREQDLIHGRTSGAWPATLLHVTAFNGFDECSFAAPATMPEIATLLIARGAEVDALVADNPKSTPLCSCLSSWWTHAGSVQTKLADVYLAGGAALEGVRGEGAPLGHAIAFGYTRSVEHLVARGARADHLVAAAALGDVATLRRWWNGREFALESMNFARSEKDETGRFSWPPPRDPDPIALVLTTAATHGRLEVVQWALGVGADPDCAVTRNQTALHFAAYVGHPSVVETLLAAKAQTDIRESQFDRTPAEWARETNELVLAERIESYR